MAGINQNLGRDRRRGFSFRFAYRYEKFQSERNGINNYELSLIEEEREREREREREGDEFRSERRKKLIK